MLVFVPTREDVLAIRSIEEAFDLWTKRVTRREVALIRVALAEGLVIITDHAKREAADEYIEESDLIRVIRTGRPASKDVDVAGSRQVGVNFEGTIERRRRIRVKIGWDRSHYTATVHSI